MAKLPFSKDEYYQMLNNMLTVPPIPTGQMGGDSPMDRLRQAVMNQVRPAMTATAGTIQ